MKDLRRQKKELGIPVWEKVQIRTDHDGNLLSKAKNKN